MRTGNAHRKVASVKIAQREQEGWRDHAACLGGDPELWFDPAREDDARAVCAGCPVLVDCRREAAAEPLYSHHGIRAGMDPIELHEAQVEARWERRRNGVRVAAL